jgi:cobalamin transport system substrate-binding protein
VLLAAGACSGSSPTYAASGATPAAEVRRIVSLAPSITEILFALGAGDRVVGVSTYCDYPPAAARVDRIGTFLDPNVELILAKKPDLVIGVPSPGNREPVEALQDLGVRVLVVDPERVTAILSAIRTVAEAVGSADEGERLVRQIESDLDAVRRRLEGAERRKVLMVVGRVPLIAAGEGTYQDELIRLAHGTNLAAASGEAWPHLSLEFVIREAPEVIIDTSMGSEEAREAEGGKAFWRQFSTIPAVRDDRIHGYRAYQLLRPGPRVAQTLEAVARYVHPERFEEKGTSDEHDARRGNDAERRENTGEHGEPRMTHDGQQGSR